MESHMDALRSRGYESDNLTDLSDLSEHSYSDNEQLDAENSQRTLPDTIAKARSFMEEIQESNVEYKTELIYKANELAHSFYELMINRVDTLQHLYSLRFPELLPLVGSPLEYAAAANALGNKLDVTSLPNSIPAPTKMVITVAVADTKGRLLTPNEIQECERLQSEIKEIHNLHNDILGFAQSRIAHVAPNLSFLVGNAVAANLLAAVGGLSNFVQVPSCNIAALGSKRTLTNIGLSAASVKHNQGFLYAADIIKGVPRTFREKALRILAAKVCLAARLDLSCNPSMRSTEVSVDGRKIKEDVDRRIQKLLELPNPHAVHALPIPDTKSKKRRAGKKIQRLRGQFKMTELRKLQNRMAFGVPEEEIALDDETEGLGMLGQKPTGSIGASTSIRSAQVDSRTKLKLNKARRHELDVFEHIYNRNRTLGSIENDGIQSSLKFSSQEGMELVNPMLSQKKEQKEQKTSDISKTQKKWI